MLRKRSVMVNTKVLVEFELTVADKDYQKISNIYLKTLDAKYDGLNLCAENAAINVMSVSGKKRIKASRTGGVGDPSNLSIVGPYFYVTSDFYLEHKKLM